MMPIKRCCLVKCKSCSTRNEDKGVTYHKFPKDADLCDKWAAATHCPTLEIAPPLFVCSRHFCKRDFIQTKDSKYILKSDAVPSMFPSEVVLANMEAQGSNTESTEKTTATVENVANISGSSKGSEIENLDNIKKFIEAQEKDTQDKNDIDEHFYEMALNPDENLQKVNNSSEKADVLGALEDDLEKDLVTLENFVENIGKPAENLVNMQRPEDVIKPVENDDDETMAVASSVMEMILSKTEAQALETENVKHKPKSTINSGNTSMPLSVGSKVEAKDFSEDWYPAQIAEVDYDEMEVLVHYEVYLRKPDEWISVSSPRLRPFTGITAPKPQEKPTEVAEVTVETKEKEGSGKVFVVGERCLARWRDNRRFVATIDKDLGGGKFEVIFDDGFRWPCTISRLSKLKEQRDALTIDTTLPPVTCLPPPVLQGGPTTARAPAPVPTYHTHLFDPTRDYLGSKSERREKKRKLNIKEIFNIGQKKYKMPKIEKSKKVVKPKVKAAVEIEKQALPVAVASIIGTVSTSQIKPQIKDEPMDIDFCNMDRPDDSTDSKSDLDPIDEEDRLERFDRPDQFVHNQVIDKMKEAISILEGGLKKEIRILHSPVRYDSPKTVTDLKLEIASPKSGARSESPKLLVGLLTQEITSPKTEMLSPKTEMLSPKLQHQILTPNMETEPPNSYTACMEPDSKTRAADVKEEITETTKLVTATEIEKQMYAFDTQENQVAVNDESVVDIEVSIVDVPSPSLIEEADFNIVPDDDSTKSDIEMGAVSPRLDIDSQPILVDIDAPLDIDEPQSYQDSTLVAIKKKKMKLKDFVKTKKKVKKEQKKKELHKKWEEVDRVKNELAEMKIKMKEMLQKIEREKQTNEGVPLPESCLLPDEWACHWVNGQPLGKVSEMQVDSKPDASGKPALPRRSVEVFDKRLPAGWTKHMVRRSVGHSAGKWDVVLVSPANRRFHTKLDMRHFLEIADEHTKSFEHSLMDFGIHLKLARKLGWVRTTPDGVAEAPETILPANSQSCLSPLVKRKALALKKSVGPKGKKKRPIKLKLQRRMHTYNSQLVDIEGSSSAAVAPEPEMPVLEDGYVWVGSLKVQVIENLLRCPAEGCFKNFRNNALLMMHIKHYHRDMRKMLGATPKVLDLAAARTKPTRIEPRHDSKINKVRMNKPLKREEYYQDVQVDVHTPPKEEQVKVPRSQDSPKLRLALNKPVKRPRVLLPMRRMEDQPNPELLEEDIEISESTDDAPVTDILDFETAISTHTVTKPSDKKKKFATFSKQISEDEEWFAINSDDVETRSSFPRSATPDDSKIIDPKTGLMISSDPMDEQMSPALYTFTENGQRIKIVHMKREEIINCHCGFREEDGLMVQCELCLCWQHALCHNIQKESEVPEKYMCSICLNPRRGRRSMRFLHDQDRMYEGLLPGAKQDESLRRSHELAGNLLRIEDALHALRVKYYVASKKDHPKLYLWAKDWEQTEITQKLNSEYSDLTVMINGMRDKEDSLSKPGSPTASADDQIDSERCSRGDNQLGSQALLSGLLSSPSTASLELPISTSELERLARTVQEAAEAAEEWQTPEPSAVGSAPQPEAAIENDVCRERLLKHIQRCQAALDSRLDSIEAQVAELESQEPSFGEHYETADHYPRIKQTVQMLIRDLDAMDELGVIT